MNDLQSKSLVCNKILYESFSSKVLLLFFSCLGKIIHLLAFHIPKVCPHIRKEKKLETLCCIIFNPFRLYCGKLHKKNILKDMEFKFNMEKVILAFLREIFYYMSYLIEFSPHYVLSLYYILNIVFYWIVSVTSAVYTIYILQG